MNSTGLVNLLNTIFIWITRITVVNILWVLYTLKGLIIAGVFPATLAILSISRKWLSGAKNINLHKAFKQSFKKEFIASNIAGWLLTIIGSILYVNYKVMLNMTEELLGLNIFAFYLILFFYFQLVIWLFPIISHYNGTIFQHLKNSIIIGTGKIHMTILSLLWLFAVLYLSLKFPASIIFVSISIGSIGWNWISLRTFHKLDLKSNSDKKAT